MTEIYERVRSGRTSVADKGEGGSEDKHYQVLGTTSKATALALARALAPLAVAAGEETLVRQSVVADATDAVDVWNVDVHYGPESDEKSKERPQPGTWTFSFSTTGGRATKTVAKMRSRHWASSSSEAPNLKGALNWDGKSVKGVDVVVPNLKFQIKAYYEPQAVTTTFMRELARKTARTNSDKWLGFEPGELLYFGGEAQGDIPTVAGQRVAPIPVTHYFEAQENLADVPELSGIAGVNQGKAVEFDEEGVPSGEVAQTAIIKKGWWYLWVKFRKQLGDDNQVVGVPEHVYVHQPYEELKFLDFFGFG